jgi:hypothetical protein
MSCKSLLASFFKTYFEQTNYPMLNFYLRTHIKELVNHEIFLLSVHGESSCVTNHLVTSGTAVSAVEPVSSAAAALLGV